MEHKNYSAQANHIIGRWLNAGGYTYHEEKTPTYGDQYFIFYVTKDKTNEKVISITMKKDGNIMFTLHVSSEITGISFAQRQLAKETDFPKWFRIECGYKDLPDLLNELDAEKNQIRQKII